MAEQMQERVDVVRDFISRADKMYREMLRELEEHAKFIYYNCPFQGRLTVSLIDGSVDWIDFDGKRVDYTNIAAALEYARHLSAIAREYSDAKMRIEYIRVNELNPLKRAITIAESVGLEVPPEARERLRQLEQEIEELERKAKRLAELCRQLQNPYSDGDSSNGGYRDCEGPGCPH